MAPALVKAMLSAAVLSSLGAAQPLKAQHLKSFDSFIQSHARSYQRGSAEFVMRQTLYEERFAASELHNSQVDRLWTAGVNKLWDWTEAELRTLRGWDGSMRPDGHGIRPHSTFLQQRNDLPDEKIWSNLAATQHIRNQGDCGSCWAIATATVLEAQTEIHTGKRRTFSPQQIVQCTQNPQHCGGDGGCKGATAELAMDWVMQNGCVEDSNDPYTGADGACTSGNPSTDMSLIFSASSSGPALTGGASFGMTGWETLPKNQYEPLMRAIADRGPVAVSVAADAWFNYESGIFNGCGKDAVIDHAVTAIGYGQDAGTKYWVIQNSWGGEWGESGHIRLERHVDGDYCGMNNDPQKGVACKGETAAVPVCGMCGVLFDSTVPHFG